MPINRDVSQASGCRCQALPGDSTNARTRDIGKSVEEPRGTGRLFRQHCSASSSPLSPGSSAPALQESVCTDLSNAFAVVGRRENRLHCQSVAEGRRHGCAHRLGTLYLNLDDDPGKK